MEWIVIVLILILFALGSISSAISHLSNMMANKISNPPQPPDPSGIEEQLKNIFRILGGEAKLKEETEKKRKDLKERLIRIEMSDNKKTLNEAQAEADKLFEDAEFEETHTDYPFKFESLERWVIQTEIEERYKGKYGRLLGKAREYIKDKDKIERLFDSEIYKGFGLDGTNYEGKEWIIEQLVKEKLLEAVKEYNPDGEDKILYYKVIKT